MITNNDDRLDYFGFGDCSDGNAVIMTYSRRVRNITDHAESSLRRYDLKAVYKSIRLICGTAGSSQSMPIARKDGTLCRSAAEELDRWSDTMGRHLIIQQLVPMKESIGLLPSLPAKTGLRKTHQQLKR